VVLVSDGGVVSVWIQLLLYCEEGLWYCLSEERDGGVYMVGWEVGRGDCIYGGWKAWKDRRKGGLDGLDGLDTRYKHKPIGLGGSI
jgi:hypothetical protein